MPLLTTIDDSTCPMNEAATAAAEHPHRDLLALRGAAEASFVRRVLDQTSDAELLRAGEARLRSLGTHGDRHRRRLHARRGWLGVTALSTASSTLCNVGTTPTRAPANAGVRWILGLASSLYDTGSAIQGNWPHDDQAAVLSANAEAARWTAAVPDGGQRTVTVMLAALADGREQFLDLALRPVRDASLPKPEATDFDASTWTYRVERICRYLVAAFATDGRG